MTGIQAAFFSVSSPAVFTPDGGNSSDSRVTVSNSAFYPQFSTTVTISVDTPTTWSYVLTGDSNAAANVANNGVSNSILFSLPTDQSVGRSSTFTVDAVAGSTAKFYTIQLDTFAEI